MELSLAGDSGRLLVGTKKERPGLGTWPLQFVRSLMSGSRAGYLQNHLRAAIELEAKN